MLRFVGSRLYVALGACHEEGGGEEDRIRENNRSYVWINEHLNLLLGRML